MWIQHLDFLNLVAQNWNFGISGNPQYVLAQNLKALKKVLKVWNKNVFGEISCKVKDVESAVEKLQEELNEGPSDELHQVLQEAKSQLHNWLKIKETHWHQKSRIIWLNGEDRNGSFFHAYAKTRGATNSIHRIQSNGTWIEDPNQIKNLAVNHFSNIAQSIQSIAKGSLFDLASRKVSMDPRALF
ncbi:hypothetical protein AAC387_Pa09g0451 [Persea americana]